MFFTQGKVGRYLDDWVLEDEVFSEQDQLMRLSIWKVVLQANQLRVGDGHQSWATKSSYIWLKCAVAGCWMLLYESAVEWILELAYMPHVKLFYNQSWKILSTAHFREIWLSSAARLVGWTGGTAGRSRRWTGWLGRTRRRKVGRIIFGEAF